MLRFLIIVVTVAALGALIAPDFRQVLTWVLAFFSALLLGDLVRSLLAGWRHRS